MVTPSYSNICVYKAIKPSSTSKKTSDRSPDKLYPPKCTLRPWNATIFSSFFGWKEYLLQKTGRDV